MNRVRSAAAAVAVAGAAFLVGPVSPASGDDDVIATITDERIGESSALVQSTVDPDLAYTINDSGNDTVVYVLQLASGEVVGTATLDVDAEDTEAMAIGFLAAAAAALVAAVAVTLWLPAAHRAPAAPVIELPEPAVQEQAA